MDWHELTSIDQLELIKQESSIRPQIIFKHSTRCSISSMAKNRLESEDVPENTDFHYLDLISFRDVSNQIAEVFGVKHESPQIIIVSNGKAVYDASHSMIKWSSIKSQL